MITCALTALLLSSPHAAVKPGELVSKMFVRYADAQKLSGTILFKQSGGGASVSFSTAVQYSRPFKLYIRQEKKNTNQFAITVADGTMFTYEMPDTVGHKPGDRLYELQNQNGVVNNIADIYTIAQPGLLDRSPVLDILIAKTEHLRFFRGQIASVGWQSGSPPAAGQPGIISGNWRAYATAPVTGKYVMVIDSEGDLVRYTVNESVSVPGQNPIPITSDWTVNIKVGDPGEENLYRVVRR